MLTDAERQRFADYLEQDAVTSSGLADQMEKLGGPMMVQLAKKHRMEAAAATIVARRLRAAESMTIGKDSER